MKNLIKYLLLLVGISAMAQGTIPESSQGVSGRMITFKGAVKVDSILKVPVSKTTPNYSNLNNKGLIRVNSETDALEYHNGTEWIASSGVNQNNIPRVLKVYYENNQNGIVINQVLKAINEEGFFENVNLTIDEFETYIISAYPIFNPAVVGWIPPVYKYKVVNIGKNNPGEHYGFEGIPLTADNLELIYSAKTNASDIIDENTQFANIPSLGGMTIEEYVNQANPPYVLQDRPQGTVIFNIGSQPNFTQYWFLNRGGTYGLNNEQTTFEDFALLGSETLPALQPGDNVSELVNDVGYITSDDGDLQATMERGNSTNLPFISTYNSGEIAIDAFGAIRSQGIIYAPVFRAYSIFKLGDSGGFELTLLNAGMGINKRAEYLPIAPTTFTGRQIPDVNFVKSLIEGNEYLFPADVNHVMTFGQSLALGATAPGITSAFSPNMLMMVDSNNPSLGYTPLDLTNSAEIAVGGTARALYELGLKRGQDFSKSQFLFDWTGVGGASIDQLNKGTAPYNTLLTYITNAKTIANNLGKSYSFYALEWIQGEQDMHNMAKEVYIEKLIQLKKDINTDVQAITGQKNDIIFLTYQPSSFNHSTTDYNPDFITLYPEMPDRVKNFYFGNANYDKVYNDGVHLNAISYKRMGAEFGIILDKLLTKQNYERFKLVSSSYSGKTINLVFNKNIAIDDSVVSFISGYGFLMDDNSIVSVEALNNRLTLEMTSNVVEGNILTYAFNSTGYAGNVTGPRGNIRSSEVNEFSFGTTYEWMPHSKITMTNVIPEPEPEPVYDLDTVLKLGNISSEELNLTNDAGTRRLFLGAKDDYNYIGGIIPSVGFNVPLFINEFGGNVVIGGTVAPDEKLIVVGNIKSNKFIANSSTEFNPSLGTSNNSKLIVSNGVSPTYGIGVGVRDNGNTWIQSQRFDGLTNVYNLELNPEGSSAKVLIGTGSDNGSKLQVAGTISASNATASNHAITLGQNKTSILTKTANYTILLSDYGANKELVVFCDASSGTFSVNIPASASILGYKTRIKKTDSSVNAVTADANGSELIEQATTYNLTLQNQVIQLESNNSQLYITN